MAHIYKITSPEGKVYVGATKQLQKRWSSYKNMSNKEQRKIYESFLKYGVDNHLFEIIVECKEEEMKELEVHYGLLYKALEPDTGLNLRLPGLVSKERIVWNRGKRGLQEAWNKGLKGVLIPWNKGAVGKQIAWNKGIPMKKETKEKLSAINKGQKPATAKIVLDLSTGIYYDSCREAADIIGYKRTTLQAMLDGQNPNKTNLIYA